MPQNVNWEKWGVIFGLILAILAGVSMWARAESLIEYNHKAITEIKEEQKGIKVENGQVLIILGEIKTELKYINKRLDRVEK